MSLSLHLRGRQGCPHHLATEVCRDVPVTSLPTSAGTSPSLCHQPLPSSPPFQKHYFPIDYTVRVQYEEVLRPSNITRLVRTAAGDGPAVGTLQ